MKAYKGFKKYNDGTLWCLDFQYEVGKTYKYNGEIMLCKRGFHACHELHQCWYFYPNNGNNVFYEVECKGKIIDEKDENGKFVCSEITLIKEVDMNNVEKFKCCTKFHKGIAIVQRENNKFILLNTKGQIISDFNQFF